MFWLLLMPSAWKRLKIVHNHHKDPDLAVWLALSLYCAAPVTKSMIFFTKYTKFSMILHAGTGTVGKMPSHISIYAIFTAVGTFCVHPRFHNLAVVWDLGF